MKVTIRIISSTLLRLRRLRALTSDKDYYEIIMDSLYNRIILGYDNDQRRSQRPRGLRRGYGIAGIVGSNAAGGMDDCLL